MKFTFPYTDRQLRVLENSAKILHIGAGTKTGKSMALFCWLIQGLLRGEACVFTGPWFHRSRSAFDTIKLMLAHFIQARQVRVNEARLQLQSSNGGYLDFTSADNPNAAFGGNYSRVVIDEASRCPKEIYVAALTTISATGGKLRTAFNLELGTRNWAIAALLRVQRMSPEERAASGEDYMTFPSGGDGLVDPAVIALMRSQMPEPLWRALYLGEIPESDTSLFRNLDRIFVGQELEAPELGVEYYLAADLARKSDWTVLTLIDNRGRVVAMDRFHQVSWTLQVERAKLWYTTFRCRTVIVDGTGVGDVVAEEFEKAGMSTEVFLFTVPSRRALVEELVYCVDNRELTLPATEKFRVYRSEMESMEFVLDGTSVRYAVPSGQHDDALFSLALAAHIYRTSRGWVLGLLDFFKRTAKDIMDGVRNPDGDLIDKPLPLLPPPVVEAKSVVDNFTIWLQTHRAPPCEACHSEATTYHADKKIFCNQCHSIDGVPPAQAIGRCCSNYLPQMTAGGTRCGNCGHMQSNHAVVIGMSRADYGRRRFSSSFR